MLRDQTPYRIFLSYSDLTIKNLGAVHHLGFVNFHNSISPQVSQHKLIKLQHNRAKCG